MVYTFIFSNLGLHLILLFGNFDSLFFSYLSLFVAAIFTLILINKKPKDFKVSLALNGNNILIISLILIFVLSPAIVYFTGSMLPRVFETRNWKLCMPKVNFMASLAIYASALGVHFENRKTNRLTAPDIYMSLRRFSNLSFIFGSGWFIYYLIWARSQGNFYVAIFGTKLGQRNYGISKANGYGADALLGTLGVMSICLIISMLFFPKFKKLFIFLYLSLLLPAFANGLRSKFIFYGLVLILILLSKSLKVKKIYVLISLVLIPILVVSPRVFRGSTEVISVKSLIQGFEMRNIIDTFTQEDLAMAPALSLLVEEKQNNNIEYFYGSSYLNSLAKPIPRSLFSNKSTEFDSQINSLVFPVESRYVGLSFSALSEPYINFGYVGIILFFFFVSKICQSLYIRVGYMPTPLNILLNSWVAGFTFVLVRGNLTTDIQRLAFPLITALIIYFLSARTTSSANFSGVNFKISGFSR